VCLDGDEMAADADDGDAGHVSGTYVPDGVGFLLLAFLRFSGTEGHRTGRRPTLGSDDQLARDR
jgi:hypothetical protein